MDLSIAVIYGSVRENRKGIKAARYILNKLEEKEINYTFVDAKEYKLPLLDKMYKEYGEGEAPKDLQKLHDIFEKSDGFLIISGEYNHGTPPALKNMLDHFQPEFHYKPSGIATYSPGIFGGVRNAMHLRAVTGELGMPSIPTMFPMPKLNSNFDNDGNTENEYIDKGFDKFIKEFIWYAEALKEKKLNSGTPK